MQNCLSKIAPVYYLHCNKNMIDDQGEGYIQVSLNTKHF